MARKQLNDSEAQGRQAIQLIESAVKASPNVPGSVGKLVNVVA
jgi:hypothetical protein